MKLPAPQAKAMILFGATYTILIALIVSELSLDWRGLVGGSTAKKARVMAATDFTVELGAIAPLRDLSGFIARPVFDPERKPLGIQNAGPPPVDVPDSPSLLGVVTSDDGSFAMLRLRAGGEAVHARVGDAVGRYKVLEVLKSGVRLSGVEGELFLRLNAPKADADGRAKP